MSIYKKLLSAKKEMQAITKDSKNPFFKSNYFDINSLLKEVEPILQKHNLLLLQPIEAEWVKSIIFDIETNEKVSSEMHLPDLKDPQKLGSAITYYRRYTLQSLLGLQAEDDDGNNSSKPQNKKKDIKVVKQKIKASQIASVVKTNRKDHALHFLANFDMTEDQRKVLESIANG